jgi:hypothetical protein
MGNTPMRADNSRHLVAAAQRRSDQTLARAQQALRELQTAGQPISVAAVAARAGVSRAWLYTQPELRQQITALRHAPRPPRHRSHTRQPRTPRYDSGSPWPTSASANSPTRTSSYATRSPRSTGSYEPPRSAPPPASQTPSSTQNVEKHQPQELDQHLSRR